jgi:hypothetical protein
MILLREFAEVLHHWEAVGYLRIGEVGLHHIDLQAVFTAILVVIATGPLLWVLYMLADGLLEELIKPQD